MSPFATVMTVSVNFGSCFSLFIVVGLAWLLLTVTGHSVELMVRSCWRDELLILELSLDE